MPADPTHAGRGAVPRLLWPPGIFLLVLMIGVVVHLLAPAPIVPVFPARVLGGIVLIAAGALATWAQRVMKAAGTHIHPWKPTTALVEIGPFARTRNPMYTALCLVHAGIGLLIGGLGPVAFTGVLFVALDRLVIVREERYLAGVIGDVYLGYCRRVPRWGWRIRGPEHAGTG